MSGDVQPRKRKDKKRKKDDLGIEEPRGTAAALGEGDVFMHSYHEHGTGGHWCAKIIFFSLLAVLVTLIGLIILENRGLSELEANAVESRYSGVLEGWLEDAPDDDHHDEHTLELTHHDDDDHEEEHDDEEVEVEKLEKEEPDEEPISTELPALPEDDDDDDDDDVKDDKNDEGDLTETESDQEEYEKAEEEDEYLEGDDIDEPAVEPITALPGKPLPEVEEEISSEQPPDTLAEEEEYEKRQEELRREEEQSSHMWLKLTVGGALLAATHAVMRRATRSRDAPEDEEPTIAEDISLTDRRLTLIPEEQLKSVKRIVGEAPEHSFDRIVESAASVGKPALVKKQESEEEKYSDEEEIQDTAISTEDNKELYSDDEEAEDDEEVVEEPKQIVKQSTPVVKSKPALQQDEELEEDDVEIIEDEQLEEELEEEDEEDISDVDDAELLTRLEAKYGKLPEPERPGQKHFKDGGNSVEDIWPGEPSDAYWRGQLDSAERELLQDWLD